MNDSSDESRPFKVHQFPTPTPESAPIAEEVPEKPKKKHRLIISIIVAILLAGSGAAAYFFYFRGDDSAPAQSPNQATEEEPTANHDPTKLRIIATGDMIAHDAINAQAKQTDGSYDYYQFMDNMKVYFDAADVRFCNQAVLGAGTAFGISGYPVFNSPVELARDMQKLGCNVINTGTNHTNDKSQSAINASVAVWDTLDDILAVAGANRSAEERQQVRYFESRGVTFAFLSYTTYTNAPGETSYGLTMWDETLAQAQLAEARESADIVLVSMRWGTEYSPGINAQQDHISNQLAEMGVDIIFGHGPHVLEPVNKITSEDGRETYVWYSLGNFLNSQLETEALVNGIAAIDIDLTTKKVASIGYLPVYMHYDWTAEQKAREDLLARKGFELYLLEEAAEPLSRSQLGTTIEEQLERIRATLNQYIEVPILTKDEYLGN